MGTNSKEKPLSCEVSESLFSGKSTLRKHIETYTSGKPFSCEVCGSTFPFPFQHANTH